MIVPPFLKKGSLIGLVSPAGKVAESEIKRAEDFLDAHGYRHIRAPHVVGAWHQFSSTDEKRAADFMNMLNNDEVDAIWCSRGGYGAIRLLDMIDFSLLKSQPKWLIGYSDITIFHAVLQNVYGVISIHGPMARSLKEGSYDETGMTNLWRLLNGQMPAYKLPTHAFNRTGKAKGTLIGGNLSLLFALIGSPYDFDPEGKILFIEDVGEYLYHLDRMMRALKLSGKLKGLAGLVVGQMSDMQDNETPFGLSVSQIIADVVKEYDFPVLFDFPAGHSKQNEPLLFGAKVKLSVSADESTLSFLKPE
jgi:muramoyltetrapeptide carboxypeptidase